MTYSALYLKFPNGKQIPINVKPIAHGLLVEGLERNDIRFELVGLDALQQQVQPAPRRPGGLDPRSLSPVDVVAYFEQSPILSIYADDVRTAVLSPSEGLQADYQLQKDLQAVQGLVGPSQADIAERLFGDRGKTGGSYRKRILAVLGATTTHSSIRSEGRREGKAA